jgi:hypothetical protein
VTRRTRTLFNVNINYTCMCSWIMRPDGPVWSAHGCSHVKVACDVFTRRDHMVALQLHVGFAQHNSGHHGSIKASGHSPEPTGGGAIGAGVGSPGSHPIPPGVHPPLAPIAAATKARRTAVVATRAFLRSVLVVILPTSMERSDEGAGRCVGCTDASHHVRCPTVPQQVSRGSFTHVLRIRGRSRCSCA